MEGVVWVDCPVGNLEFFWQGDGRRIGTLPNITPTLNPNLNWGWWTGYITQCHSDLDSNLKVFVSLFPPGSKVIRKWKHGGSASWGVGGTSEIPINNHSETAGVKYYKPLASQ